MGTAPLEESKGTSAPWLLWGNVAYGQRLTTAEPARFRSGDTIRQSKTNSGKG